MNDDLYCPYFHHTVELVGRRWSGVILRALVAGPIRFGDIRGQIPGLSDRLLTNRLAEFEAEGLVRRCEHNGIACYRMTAKGRSVEPVLDALAAVAVVWSSEESPGKNPGRIRS